MSPEELPAAPVAAEPVATPVAASPTPAPAPTSAPSAPIDVPVIVTPTSAPPIEAVADPVEPDAAPPVAAEPEKPTAGAEAPETPPTLLEAAVTPPEDKKPAEEATKAAETAVLKYEPFKLPEDVKIDDKQLDGFREIAGKHNVPQEAAQALLDLHTGTLKEYAKTLASKQWSDFQSTQEGWLKRINTDPVLGGANFESAKGAALRMRDLLVPEAYRQEYIELCRDTGAGNHPALMRIFHNAARLFDEPAAPPIPARPTPDRGGSAKKSAKEMMYDHSSSRAVARR